MNTSRIHELFLRSLRREETASELPPGLKPGREPAPAPPAAPPPLPARTIRLLTSPPGEPPQAPARTWLNAKLGEMDVHREALILDQLAELTDRHGPYEAALRLFGGRR